jgi:hypothetical protein
MKRMLAAVLCAAAMIGAPLASAEPPLEFAQLKTMISGMGYTAKDLPGDTPKFYIDFATATFNIPTGFEISKSGRYIWVTANLGVSKLNGDLALQALHKIGGIQPTSFWLTEKNNLMIGFAIDNRDVTPAHLKFVLEKFSADIDNTASLWQAAP